MTHAKSVGAMLREHSEEAYFVAVRLEKAGLFNEAVRIRRVARKLWNLSVDAAERGWD